MDSQKTNWDKIEIHQKNLDNLLGDSPAWLINWGMSLIFIFVGVLFTLSFFFKYPDTIDADAVILTINPPVTLVARNPGRLDAIFVKDESIVHAGDILSVIENTGHYNNILKLKRNLIRFDSLSEDSQLLSELGYVQELYSNYIKQYNEYKNFLSLQILDNKTHSITQQINDYSKHSKILMEQVNIQKETAETYYKQYMRDSMLYKKNVISTSDLEKSKLSLLQFESNYNSTKATYNSTLLQTNQLKFQLIDLKNQYTEQTQKYLYSLKESFDNLKAGIDDWEKSYVLYSPVEGKIIFNKFWTVNQYVNAQEAVFTIIPIKPQEIICRIKIPINGSGRVLVGQKVIIRVNNFPYNEFGSIIGQIKKVSLIPEKTTNGYFYNAEVQLPNGLTTNYKKKLPLNQEMQGIAKIVTKDLPIIERLLNPIKSAIKQSI